MPVLHSSESYCFWDSTAYPFALHPSVEWPEDRKGQVCFSRIPGVQDARNDPRHEFQTTPDRGTTQVGIRPPRRVYIARHATITPKIRLMRA